MVTIAVVLVPLLLLKLMDIVCSPYLENNQSAGISGRTSQMTFYCTAQSFNWLPVVSPIEFNGISS